MFLIDVGGSGMWSGSYPDELRKISDEGRIQKFKVLVYFKFLSVRTMLYMQSQTKSAI